MKRKGPQDGVDSKISQQTQKQKISNSESTLQGDEIKIGVLGGGQLGRMMAYAAHRLGISLTTLDPGGEQSPTGQVCHQAISGKFDDAEKIKQISERVHILTTEIEHVDVKTLRDLESSITVQPSSHTIEIIQDKYLQKMELSKKGVAVAESVEILEEKDLHNLSTRWGYPLMLKAKRLAYDGRGNYVIKDEKDIPTGFKKLTESLVSSSEGAKLYAERWVKFKKELGVMVARSVKGEIKCYPVVETVQRDNICHTVIAPALISARAKKKAEELSIKAIQALEGAGIFGVELFLLDDEKGEVLLNEIAPRPHNSGHYTIEACYTDQFEQHLRAILDFPLGDPSLKVPAAGMVNLLGAGDEGRSLSFLSKESLNIPGASLHLYGKKEDKKGRKMGHITFIASNPLELNQRMKRLLDLINRIETGGLQAVVEKKEVVKEELKEGKQTTSERTSMTKFGGFGQALVSVIMGSDSDLSHMKDGCDILEKFEIPYELSIVSAHRTPVRMNEYAPLAHQRGIRVIIAGAGGAAHLPGMVASQTPLPVIGVPVKTSTLNGEDSLLSIVQMPKGIPVATVAISNSANAGLLAVRILAASNPSPIPGLPEKIIEYQETLRDDVLKKAEKLEKIGYKEYLSSQTRL